MRAAIVPAARRLAALDAVLDVLRARTLHLLGEKEKQKKHAYLYWSFYERQGGQAVRMGKWKAVQQPIHSAVRLYDLEKDVGEKTDLAGEQKEVVERAKKFMAEAHVPSERWKFPAKKN